MDREASHGNTDNHKTRAQLEEAQHLIRIATTRLVRGEGKKHSNQQ